MDGKRVASLWGIAALLVAPASWLASADPGSPGQGPTARVRRPIAAAFLADGQALCVANQRSGSLSLVDPGRAQVRGEFVVGQHLTGLAVLPDRKHLLVVDDKRNELIALTFDGARLSIQTRLSVAPYPVSVAVLADGTRASVASLWSRRLKIVDLRPLTAGAEPIRLRVLHTLRLPFAPRLQCPLPSSSQVVVADAFGGHLAVVDAAQGRLVAVHELDGHNLRGLALDGGGRNLLIAHQILNQKAATTRENIASGSLMANVVRWVAVDQLRNPEADLNRASRTVRLGTVGAGAGDPAGLAVVNDTGRVAVALAGVHEVALVEADGTTSRRLPVGRRPTVVVAGPPGKQAVIVNTFDDSLSVLDPRRGAISGRISLGPPPKLDPQDRGERLFFDARLGRDGWLSCHSCHSDGHTNGLLADTLGDQTYGTPKRTLTLMGTALTDPWGWNGGMKYLHDQVQHSLVQTMHSAGVTGEQVNDLVSFLHTLPPPPPPEPVTADPADRAQVERGRQVFHERGCIRCHIPPLTYTSHGTYDVGFADEKGLKNFNPPSLRGVGQGYGFLHDNRAKKLEQVFTTFHHKVGRDAPSGEVADLVRFLRSL